MFEEVIGAFAFVDPEGGCGDWDVLFQRSVDGSDKTPVSSVCLPVVLDRKALRRVRVRRPKTEIEEVHQENEVDSTFILGFRMQCVLRPGLEAIALFLHETPDLGRGGFGPIHVQSDISRIFVDIFGIFEDFRVRRRRVGVGIDAQRLPQKI